MLTSDFWTQDFKTKQYKIFSKITAIAPILIVSSRFFQRWLLLHLLAYFWFLNTRFQNKAIKDFFKDNCCCTHFNHIKQIFSKMAAISPSCLLLNTRFQNPKDSFQSYHARRPTASDDSRKSKRESEQYVKPVVFWFSSWYIGWSIVPIWGRSRQIDRVFLEARVLDNLDYYVLILHWKNWSY